ncbi:MAG: cation diffusion facilitator family transporter [Candidatus Lokiarchaeota archaeon]|nr:cation diffusion facilitator family transporter [Candidatus Lokiarchaeota archaeon]
MTKQLQEKLERRVSVYSIILVVLVSIIKTVMIFFTNSVSYRGEFIDSIIDIAIVGLTFTSLKFSRKPADADHMYGHYKINSFMGIIESLLTMGLYGYIFYSAISAILKFDEYTVENPLWSIYSLIGIIIINISLSSQIVKIGKKLDNAVIKSQGVNFRGDLFRNIAVVGALIGAYFNVHIMDPILAILAVIYAFYESIKIIKVSFNELIDYNALDPDRIEKTKNFIISIPEIASLQQFAIRTVAKKLELVVKLVLKTQDAIKTNQIISIIKRYVEEQFRSYDINSFIEVKQIEDEESSPMNALIFEKIKKMRMNHHLLQDIHNISIDRLQQMVLIQFHVKVNKNKSLTQIHSVVTRLEEQIKNSLMEEFPNIPIEILSHIEPTEDMNSITPFSGSEKLEDIDKNIREIVKRIPKIAAFKTMNLLEEAKGYFLSIIIYVDGEMTIFDAHLIAEMLELSLRQSIPELHDCIIHTEPLQ